MILVIGGAYNGKKEYVRANFGEEYFVIEDYHKSVRELCEREIEEPKLLAAEYTKKLISSLLEEEQCGENETIIICDEVGSGLVPMERFEREYREAVGRCCTLIAAQARKVIRVYAGIGRIIKNEE